MNRTNFHLLVTCGVACLLSGASDSGVAQSKVATKSKIQELIADCLNKAISNGDIERSGNNVEFTCGSSSAREIYDLLDDKVTDFKFSSNLGTGTSRAFSGVSSGTNQCYRITRRSDGSSADIIQCSLNIYLGILSEN
ncbi:hypothetical protein [Methylobacterium nigriterrae]|uniref:hypothetical protein n=1 Tax=Methylobacterium nigriterrae TaxID=3127512 RepID=UPI00301400E3